MNRKSFILNKIGIADLFAAKIATLWLETLTNL